jgi:hypothetical protein
MTRTVGIANVVLVGMAAVLACACGRPATREDCELIIDRNVELQMKQMQITEQALIDKRKAEIRASMSDQLKGCVGKRVTDKMMACVRTAASADEIDQCLR